MGKQPSHKQPAAVIGVGQTHHRAKREDVSIAGLCREAIDRALADANLGFDDIDAIVVGKAPDLFEGVMKPELYLSDALGGHGKPVFRVHTAGSVGATTGIVAAHHVETGRHKRVLAVAYQKPNGDDVAVQPISVRPGQVAEVHYSLPRWANSGGSIGLTPQPHKGGAIFLLLILPAVVVLVLFILAIVLALVVT